MNVYDFDKTIYDGDCATNFFLFSLKKKPQLGKVLLPLSIAFIEFKQKKLSRTKLKEVLYQYVKHIDNLEQEVEEFWNQEAHKIKGWYLQQQKSDDLIISASPEFLIQPICDKLGVAWMASKLDPTTGTYDGPNCYGEHKVTRFTEVYDVQDIDDFYSDSISDSPMAKLAKKAYLVTGDHIELWPIKALVDNHTIYD